MCGRYLLWFMSLHTALIGQLTCANILDVTCINFNPIYDPGSSASYAAILNGADVTSTASFQRSVDLDTGDRASSWCSHGEETTECGLPQGSVSSGTVTLNQDKFGVYGCRAERYNWTTEMSTLFIRNDADFNPDYFTVTVSLDEEIRLTMNTASLGGSGSLSWKLNHQSGGQTDLSSNVSSNELYISKANKEDHAGIHYYFYEDQPDQGGLVRLIVRACLDNLWGPDCQFTCPTCYNGGVCDDVSGRCVCPPGFSGDHCQIACEAGKFGQDCMGSCSSLESGQTNCSGAVFCLPDPYGCSCAAGWTGLTCDQACSAGSYGAGCTQTCHCDSPVSCDSVTGACSSDCEDSWIGDQCQVTVLDITAVLRQGGVHDATSGSNFLGIFMIGDSSVTDDPSLKYYIGREVDTGPGETGHGASLKVDGNVITQEWEETGLPPETGFGKFTPNSPTSQNSFRAAIDKVSGGDARVGAYRMAIDYRGWTERNILLNEYRGDATSEVWPEKLSTTVGIGETVTLSILTTAMDTGVLRWRHNGGSDIAEWNGETSVTINDIRKSDEGIYECYVEGRRNTGIHAILRLIVRNCPSSKYGFNCSQDCPVCYAGGVCHDITGECVCRAGFQGDNCEIPCGDNNWGKTCSVVCSSNTPRCPNRLFSPPDPVGMACINGYTGNRCQTTCDPTHFGADCEMDCNCDGTCDRESGCQGTCSSNYTGTYCQALRSGLDCPSGYFGTLCNYQCHCNGIEACERSSGQCPNGCADGWTGSDCQQALPRLLESPWVSDTSSDSVLVIWNAWTDGYDYGNGPVHSYQVDYTWIDGDGNTGESDQPFIITGDSTANITGLIAYSDYEFYVSARREVDSQFVSGVKSGPIIAKTDCGAPLLTPEIVSTVVDGIGSITITWKITEIPSSFWLQCESSVYSFNLIYGSVNDPSNVTTIPVGGSEDDVTETVNQLATCTAYTFSVVVINSDDLPGPANQTTAITDKISPQPVDDVSITSNSYNHLKIMWLAPFSQCGDPSYNVSRKLLLVDQCDNSMADIVNSTLIEETSIEFDDLLPYSTYEFTVLATLDGYDAEAIYMFTYNSTEFTPTAEPENFTVDSTVKGTLSYSWSIPPCGSRNGAISYYYEFREVEGDDRRNGSITETSKFFEDLKHYVEYNFMLCARTNIGPGPCISNQTRTLPSEPSVPLSVASNEELTNQTYTVITWEEPEEINGIFVRYDIQKNMEAVIELREDEKVYSFSDLEPDTEYNFRVRAVSNGGVGEWASTPVTTTPIPVPRTPGLPVVTDKGETYISIEWEHIDEAELGIYTITHYIVSVASSQSTGDGDMYDVTNITSPMVYTIEPLESGTEYFIKVQAVNEGGPGDWSESLTEATNQPPGPNAAAIGAGVGISFFLIIVVSLGFVMYTRRRRDAPAPPPKEFDLEGVEAEENGGTSSSPVAVPTAVTGTSKAKPTIKPRPPQYQPILISNLAKFVKARRLSPDGFEKEFKDLLNRSDQGCIGNNPENKPKNRYKNVVTYDEHRVKLNKLPTEPGADYVNATFMAGYKKEKAFIASQGPNTASLNDFWQMVYEQRTATIVMLTNLVEKEKTKCLKYWPASGEHEEYGELEVIGKEVEDRGSYVLRKFEVGKPGRKFHEVSQYHYTIWPDMGVPESSQPLIDFRDIVKAANPADAGATIVHCSAGAGRTGTYITIDCMMEMIEAENKIDVFNFVNNMRKRRAFMVQVQAQYEFIYETLLQWSVCKKVSFSIVDLPVTVKNWRTKHADSSKTEMSRQFEVLESIAPQESMGSDQRGSLPENAKKNRYPDRVPLDKFQPLLMTKGDTGDENEYINASFFDVEGQKNAHVCTQCPLMTTIGDFWRLVWDYDVNTVIHLNEMDSTCGQYWPDHDRVNFSSFTIELLSDKKHTDTMIERVLRVTCSNKKDERQISQFQYLGWPNDSLVPSSKMDFFDLLMQADNNNTSEKRFLVVCMDGVGASPTCLAAIATIDKVKEDKTVDVFSAVKRLRKSRPGVVDELERYEFCFDVLAAYQDSVQTYANYM